MPEPIDDPAAAGAGGITQDPGAGGSPQLPQTPPAPQTPAAPSQPKGTTPATDVNPDSTKWISKAEYDQEVERRKGLDRRISQLRGSRASQTPSENLSDEEKEAQRVQGLEVQVAENQLKEEAGKILGEYPDFPKGLASAIRKNPRGFLNSTTQTVEDAILDLEQYIADAWEEHSAGGGGSDAGKQVTVAAPNATVTTSGKPDLGSMTQEEIDAALDSGELTLKDLETYLRKLEKKS